MKKQQDLRQPGRAVRREELYDAVWSTLKTLEALAQVGLPVEGGGCMLAGPMHGQQDLTKRVREMRESGDSMDEIASRLNLSWEVVGGIMRRYETEEVLAARSRRFLEEIRGADDLERKWKVSYLMQAIRPNVMTQNARFRHFGWEEKPEIPLRELMDLVIPDADYPKPGYLLTPLLNVRCVGLEGFWSLVGGLAQADLGERCNQEWRKRLRRLERASRIVGGGRCSWSKPCEPPTWVREATSARLMVES